MAIRPDNINVHGLWIGKTLSALELLAIHSFIRNGHVFHLWTYEPVTNPLPQEVICMDANNIIPESKIFRYRHRNQFGHGKGSLGGFSDIFRYKLLYEHGGWWTDMDITCLKPLNFQEPYVFRTHQGLKMVGNLMKCPPKSELMLNCYEKASIEINAENKDWHRPIQILCDEVKKLNLENYIFDFTNPDSWRKIRKMLVSDIQIPEYWLAIHWVNEEWRRNKVNKNSYVPHSVYGNLLKLNQLANQQPSPISVFYYKFHQSYFLAGLRQSYWYFKRNLFSNHNHQK